MEPRDALQRGMIVYRQLARCGHAFRFVIFSWPSERVRARYLQDVRLKSARADWTAVHLGRFLSQFPPETPTSLIGYSLGARVVTGATHLLGGGEFQGGMLPGEPSGHIRPHVVLMAAALPNCWILPGRTHGMAASQLDQLLLMRNPIDPALKRYRFVDPSSKPAALGFTGIPTAQLAGSGTRIRQINVRDFVGRSHDVDRYLESAWIMREIRECVFWEAE